MATPGSFTIHTLGCKLNYAESSTLSRQLREAGWHQSTMHDMADVCIINTCSVTEFADKKCRQAVRRFKRNNPAAKVIVTGCYAQLKPTEISNMEGVDLVLGAAEKFNLLQHLENLQLGMPVDQIIRGPIKHHEQFFASYSTNDRTRAFLKVQDGCDYKCSFCTIPQARGKSRSASIEHVLIQAQELIAMGIKEIVLTGVNIGDFGLDSESGHRKFKFIDLLRELDNLDIPRIRISSIEPNLCTDEIISFVAGSKRFMPHFHMPLQSGSNEMLKRMRRRYPVELYHDRVELIKKLMPHACIGVDVIVGFHGESNTHFDETRAFLHDIEASYFHVFTYSERSNTHAEKMDGVVPMELRKLRNRVLRNLSDKKRHYFYNQHIKSTRPVLFEQNVQTSHGGKFAQGFTDNYIKVNCSTKLDLQNEIHSVRLTKINKEDIAMGRLIEQPVSHLN